MISIGIAERHTASCPSVPHMRTIITGGAGFIGSHLVDRLIDAGCEVHVVDTLQRGSIANLTGAHDTLRCSLHRVDVRSPEFRRLTSAIQPEVIFHLAAQIDVRSSVADPLNDAATNVSGTINVAEAARRSGCRKVVFASSGGAIYGAPSLLPATESTPLAPSSPYGAAKVCGETYLNTYRRMYGLGCTHLALANVYGARQDSGGEAGVIAIFARALLNDRSTTLFGDGLNTRDYVAVEDVVSAFLAASGESGNGARYNIGTGLQTTDRDLHTLIAKATGAADSPDFAPSREGDVRSSALDGTAANRDLGWRQTVDLIDGIGRTLESMEC